MERLPTWGYLVAHFEMAGEGFPNCLRRATIGWHYECQSPPHWDSGIEILIRHVLQIHKDPSTTIQLIAQCMDLFDRLMERDSFSAMKIFNEWDQN